MQVLPAQAVEAKLLQTPAQLSLLCSSLQQCFAFDPAAAGLLLYATADAGPHLSIPAAQPSFDSPDDMSSSTLVDSAPAATEAYGMERSGWRAGASDVLGLQQGSLSAPMLPRMPAGLAHVGSQQCYEALAAVARSIGRAAHQSGLPSVLHLPLIPQTHLLKFHVCTLACCTHAAGIGGQIAVQDEQESLVSGLWVVCCTSKHGARSSWVPKHPIVLHRWLSTAQPC